MSETNMQNFLITLWEFTTGKEDKYNFFAKTFERSKKSCRVFLSLRQVQSYRRNGKKLRQRQEHEKVKGPLRRRETTTRRGPEEISRRSYG